MESKGTYAKRSNKLKMTKFKPMPAINQKNYYTDYLKRENQLLVNRRETESPDDSKLIVIAPGSRNLKIGLADDPEPRYFPMVAARKGAVTTPFERPSGTAERAAQRFAQVYPNIYNDFEERMRTAECEIVADADATISEFNDKQKSQSIEASKTWTTDPDTVFCDDNVDPDQYNVSWPLQNGTFNEEYNSIRFLIEDLIEIFKHAMEQLGVPYGSAGRPAGLKERAKYSAVLVIPDLYEQYVVITLIDILLKELGLGRVAIVQESVSAAYAYGATSACVVDIGAQVTSVACVDEGMSLLESRVSLAYGGDDITKLLVAALDKCKFPLKFADWDNINDFKVADDIKKKICTAVIQDIAVNTESVVHCTMSTSIELQYQYYEQAIASVLGLFYPTIFESREEKFPPRKFMPWPENLYTGRYNDPVSDAQINIYLNTLSVFGQSYNSKPAAKKAAPAAADEDDESRQATPAPDKPQEPDAKQIFETINASKTAHVPLDQAIIESVFQAAKATGGGNEERFYENLILVGGGAQIPGLRELLVERLLLWKPKKKGDTGAVEPTVAKTPDGYSEFDTVWKGGCVYAKLKIIDEMWVEAGDWAVLGARILQYKTLFSYF